MYKQILIPAFLASKEHIALLCSIMHCPLYLKNRLGSGAVWNVCSCSVPYFLVTSQCWREWSHYKRTKQKSQKMTNPKSSLCLSTSSSREQYCSCFLPPNHPYPLPAHGSLQDYHTKAKQWLGNAVTAYYGDRLLKGAFNQCHPFQCSRTDCCFASEVQSRHDQAIIQSSFTVHIQSNTGSELGCWEKFLIATKHHKGFDPLPEHYFSCRSHPPN